MEDNQVAQEEELQALQAIYGEEDCTVFPEDARCVIFLSDIGVVIRALFPQEYPSDAAPLLEVEAPHLPFDAEAELHRKAEEMLAETPGNVMMFELIEWLKEKAVDIMETLEKEQEVQDVSGDASTEQWGLANDELLNDLDNYATDEAVAHELEAQHLAQVAAAIVTGNTFSEKRSVFQAHVAPARSVEDVEAVIAALLQNRKVAMATHNIMAYRIDATNGVWAQDYDDDGETAAGNRLLHLLQCTGARDVVVVVSRWYGGVKLGPDRFKIINNVARVLLDKCGYVNKSAKESHSGGSKGKRK
uniref:RWD domain-containing protein n=1 Tax=Pyramimonas obovata TaxID=1411642 RepID=A0A7S0WW15_9CHLO|mmetsp:Transcript_6997/g.14125  ORF Transcript_6997/g.14125 Transcript_6997/m.14125 type:complete len:303 (+) Transcript_6997:131-1039(+)